MLQALKTRRAEARANNDDGFTLIELMVVVLIIAILLAIAIPTFLGAQDKAKDRSAQSSVRNTLSAAKVLYADKGSYDEATAANLQAAEPSLTFNDDVTASTGPKIVSVDGSADLFYAVALSKTGDCWAIRDNAAGPGTQFAQVVAGACTAANAATIVGVPLANWSGDGF